ncbi:hypothetical protein C9H70_13745 [Clostridioides difficile]|nr:hypothetical protein [Clostridioides difficile]
MYLSIIFKLKMYKNTYIQLDIGIRGFQWWIRGESISGYLIVLLVFVKLFIQIFTWNFIYFFVVFLSIFFYSWGIIGGFITIIKYIL